MPPPTRVDGGRGPAGAGWTRPELEQDARRRDRAYKRLAFLYPLLPYGLFTVGGLRLWWFWLFGDARARTAVPTLADGVLLGYLLLLTGAPVLQRMEGFARLRRRGWWRLGAAYVRLSPLLYAKRSPGWLGWALHLTAVPVVRYDLHLADGLAALRAFREAGRRTAPERRAYAADERRRGMLVLADLIGRHAEAGQATRVVAFGITGALRRELVAVGFEPQRFDVWPAEFGRRALWRAASGLARGAWFWAEVAFGLLTGWADLSLARACVRWTGQPRSAAPRGPGRLPLRRYVVRPEALQAWRAGEGPPPGLVIPDVPAPPGWACGLRERTARVRRVLRLA